MYIWNVVLITITTNKQLINNYLYSIMINANNQSRI